jgi:hypothetical protein
MFGVLRAASGYTSEIVQTISGLTPGNYAIYLETAGGATGYTTTMTVESGGQVVGSQTVSSSS